MNWVLENSGQLLSELLSHLELSIPPIVLSFVLSIPIGWVANRYRWSRAVLLTVAGLLYAIPSLPLLIALPLIIGTSLSSPVNVIVALTLYGMALMVRSTADALDAVDPDVRQSATAVGFSGWTRFWQVEFPLAGPVLLAGLRVVVVSTVSLVTVGGVLGIPGLGLAFTDGLQRSIISEIVSGIVLVVVLALVLDGLLVLLGRALMPWTRATREPSSRALRKVVLAS
ncbi:ABC transporter permease [Frondihabitans cladoniiphilus]|uniref:ABC transporter permease subunit n=1 Tax=Frondihabitans cladoniiphilus TaxID=715785 RepID=A0ABP8VKK7_9MICO